jgi:hypothetical protein
MTTLKKLFATIGIILSISLKVVAVDEIVITSSLTQLCAGSIVAVTYTTTFPTNTVHKIQLLKNGIEISNIESTTNPIAITIPTTAVYGTDYSLKISAFGIESNVVNVTVLNPTVSQNTIYTGFNGTLTATGCGNTNVLWQNDSNSNNPIFSANPFNTPILTGLTTYNVKCSLDGVCETSPIAYEVQLTEPIITIVDYPKNLCAGTGTFIEVSTNLPSNSGFSIYLVKEGEQPINTGGGIIQNGKINFTAYPFISGTGYAFQVNYFDIKSNTTANDVTFGNFGQTVFIEKDVGQLLSYKSYCADTEAILELVLVKGGDKMYYEDIDGLSYQWQKGGVNYGPPGNIANINEPGDYQLVAIKGSCISTSSNINVLFNAINYTQIFPNTTNLCEEQDIRLTTNYKTTTSNFQWKLNGLNIPGATNFSFITHLSGEYTLEISDKTCQNTSSPKILKFGDALIARLLASEKTLCGGSGVNLSALSYDNTSSIYNNLYNADIIWQKNGMDIPGKDTRGIWVYEPGVYRFKLTQGNCVSYSQNHEVLLGSQWEKPNSTLSSKNNLDFCSGAINIFWSTFGTVYKNNNIVASNVSTYLTSESGSYKLVREPFNPCSSESDPIVITKGTLNPIISATDSKICGTEDYVTLYYDNEATFYSSFALQWEKDGEILSSNQSAMAVNTPGTYRLRVSNGNCLEYSNEIVITRNDNLTFDLKPFYGGTLEADQILDCTNRLSQITLDRFNFNHDILWFRNGVHISNSSKYFINTPQAGSYTVTATGNGCTATSNPFIINSDYVPQPNLAQSITYMNTSAALEAIGCNGTINWYDSQTSTTSLGTGPTFTTPNLSSTIPYFTDCTTATCKSAREKIDVIVESCALMVTVKSGYWDDPTVWSCNRIPYDLESVVVSTGHSIVIPTNYTAKVKDIENNGGIIVSENAILQFKTN